jgi:hypothetical protein
MLEQRQAVGTKEKEPGNFVKDGMEKTCNPWKYRDCIRMIRLVLSCSWRRKVQKPTAVLAGMAPALPWVRDWMCRMPHIRGQGLAKLQEGPLHR